MAVAKTTIANIVDRVIFTFILIWGFAADIYFLRFKVSFFPPFLTHTYKLSMYSCYCYPSQKEKLKIDDALDVSSVHGVTGILGTLAVGLIASSLINPAGPNGLIYGNPFQIGLQTLGIVTTAVFSFGGTIIIIKLLDKTIGLRVKDRQ
jgi:hypothetical protein